LVTLFKKGSAFYTKISVVGIKRELTEVLVDSGAAITGLKKEVINNCSLQPKGIKFVPTPIGGAMMQVYECDIEVNGRAIKSIFPVKVLDSKHPSGKIIESENLLGRDVLREFRIFIDWKKGEGNLEDP
jgi:predicted aspartyl protease